MLRHRVCVKISSAHNYAVKLLRSTALHLIRQTAEDDQPPTPPPEEQSFEDDDGTRYEWDPATRKFVPTQDPAGTSTAYAEEEMTFEREEIPEFDPALEQGEEVGDCEAGERS